MEGKIENIRLSFSAAGGFLATATATASLALPAYERVSLVQRRRPGVQMWLWAADSSFLRLLPPTGYNVPFVWMDGWRDRWRDRWMIDGKVDG